MDSLGAFNLILLAIPGIALRIAVRALYGPRETVVRDPLRATLSLSGTLLIVMAILGAIVGLVGAWWLVIPLGVLLLIALLVVVDRLRRAEHRALLWSLAVAAQRGIPLAEAARAYADETLGDTGARALRLAQAIEQGQPLPRAVRAARLRMAPPMRLAVGLGESLGSLGPALRQQLNDSQSAETALRDAIVRFIYLGCVLASVCGVLTFVMIKIVPVYIRLFEEFEFELPAPTIMVVNITEFFVTQWPLILGILSIPLGIAGLVLFVLFLKDNLHTDFSDKPLAWYFARPRRAVATILIAMLMIWFSPICAWQIFLCLPLLLMLGAILYLVGWLPRDLPILWRLFRRYDGALVMRGLALGVRKGLPLNQALDAVMRNYPIQRISRLLHEVSFQVAAGQNWHESLCRSRLISRADAAVLAAAERAGNLAWALEEMAESVMRRQLYRTQFVLQLVFPPALVLVGFIVMFIVVGLFLPVISLIHGLT